MLSPDFYTLNAHTEFSFPHDSCDHATDEELKALLFGGYHLPEFLTKYYVSQLGPVVGSVADIVTMLREDTDFVLAATAYLRLKFVLEVFHVPSLMKKMRNMPIRIAAERGDWFRPDIVDERVWGIDCLATSLFDFIIRRVEARCGGAKGGVLDENLRTGLIEMNTAIQSVRAVPCDGQYVWVDVAPYDLVPYPFLSLVKGLWSAVAPVVTAKFTGLGRGCSTLTGWSSPNNDTSDAFT